MDRDRGSIGTILGDIEHGTKRWSIYKARTSIGIDNQANDRRKRVKRQNRERKEEIKLSGIMSHERLKRGNSRGRVEIVWHRESKGEAGRKVTKRQKGE